MPNVRDAFANGGEQANCPLNASPTEIGVARRVRTGTETQAAVGLLLWRWIHPIRPPFRKAYTMVRARVFPPPKPFLFVLFGLFAFAAHAIDLDVKVEPGLALSLGAPQKDRFALGGAGTVKGLAGLEGGWVNLTAGLTFLALPAQSGFGSTSAGTAWAPSLGLRLQLPRESDRMRLQRPHERESLGGAKPWVDGDLMYVRTGGLDRVGFAAAVGLAFPLGESRQYQLGPFVRYFQILQGSRPGFDTRDANTIIFGLSLETGTRTGGAEYVASADKGATVAAVEAPAAKPDRDGDGVADDVDACPDKAGPASNHGCPIYEKVVVKPDKLELKEKIQFAWNAALIEPASYATLDDVVKALQDNKGFRVSIQGHTSSEGADDHNQSLSEQRAHAVLEYVANKGISRDRLLSSGFSSSQPVQSNSTESGREANRRVEFVVHFIILKEGAVQ
jgi:outer membrane protein OmpA-like peptidoglycan-associated protein